MLKKNNTFYSEEIKLKAIEMKVEGIPVKVIKERFGTKMQYLSRIIDVYNGEVIVYTISGNQTLDLVLDTLNQITVLTDNCILHSDQGSVMLHPNSNIR